MKTTLTSLLLFFCYSLSFSQESIVKFGKVNTGDFALDYSHLDSTAEYIVQFEKATVSYEYSENAGFSIKTVIEIRKHILKSSALNEGIISIPYYRGTGVKSDFFEDISATTYNLIDNKLVKSIMNKKDVLDEKIEDKYFNIKFNLPEVKVGSIIEYSYVRRTSVNLYNKPRTWYFQGEAPALWSEIEADIPGIFYNQIILSGYLPLTVNTQESTFSDLGHINLNGQGLHYRFAIQDVPAFKNEKYITTHTDYVSKIEFELSSYQLPGQIAQEFTSTWDDLDNTLKTSNNWGKNIKRYGFLSEIVDKLNKLPTDEEKIKQAYAFMTSNFKWNNENRLWSSGNLRSVFDNKIGSSVDLNLLFLNILQDCGIDANPVILSTRENGKIDVAYPLLDRFNYTLVSINHNDQKYFADVTNPILPLGVLPQRCLNKIGREIGKKSSLFVDISTKGTYSEFEEVKVELDLEEGMIFGTYKSDGSGYMAANLREVYTKLGETDFIKSLKESYADWEMEDIKLENYEKVENGLSTSFKFKKEEGGIMPDVLYLNPLLSGQITENPFKKEIREYPVDFGHETNTTSITKYQIPNGYVLEEQPAPVAVILPEKGGKFMFFVQMKGSELTIVSRIMITKPVFYAQEYPYLKEFYNRVVEKHAEQIVLIKEKN